MSQLLLDLRAQLKRVADPKRAPAMRAYMKSEMLYHGVPAALLRLTCKKLFIEIDLPTQKKWEKHVLALWRGAQFREERYGAMHLAGDKRVHAFHTPQAMPMFEEMIVTGAWWDYVDDIAAHRVGMILAEHPGRIKPLMRRWSRSDNLWKRRTSIICQLGFKKDTDLELLYACIEPSLGSREFFLRKAIGWALRQYAWTDPKEVIRYVQRNESRLNPLSRREAMKNVLRRQ